MTTSRSVHEPVHPRTGPDIRSGSVPGWRLTFIAGFVPLVAGLLALLVTWVGVVRAAPTWWVGIGSLDFSYADLPKAGADASAWVDMIGSVGGVNIVAAAVAVSVVSVVGLRTGQRWAWCRPPPMPPPMSRSRAIRRSLRLCRAMARRSPRGVRRLRL